VIAWVTVSGVTCNVSCGMFLLTQYSVVRYLRYLDKYCEYQRFDTSIEKVSTYCDATIPIIGTILVSIPHSLQLNRSIVVNYCTPRDNNEKSTSH